MSNINNETYHILIIEDEPDFQLILKAFISTMDGITFDLAASYKKAIELFNMNNYDLALLDINLGESIKSGIDIGRKIRSIDEFFPLIFLTNNFSSTYYEIIKELNPHCFLDKQLSSLKLKQAIELSMKKTEKKAEVILEQKKEAKNIMIKVGAKYKKILIEEIDYFHRKEGLSYIHSNDRSYPLHRSLSELEMLFKVSFIRVHQSYLVNTNKIMYIKTKDQEVVLENKRIPIGYTYKKQMLMKFTFLN